MAIKKSPEEIRLAIDDFVSGLPALQKQQFNQVYAMLKDLAIDVEGNIKNTIENLKVIGRIKNQLASIVDLPQYQDKVVELQNAFASVDKIQTTYYLNSFDGFSKPKSIAKLQSVAFDSTVDQLTQAEINENVVNSAAEIVESHITDGDSFLNMVDELKTSMLGNKEVDSKFISYAKQTINDMLSGFARNYHNIVTSDLGIEWFEYIGALMDTSRPICIALTHKHYIHKSELAGIAKGLVDGVQISREGMMPGTTGQNFINRCGGWNCDHQMIPIPAAVVPKNIRDKFEV